MWYNIYSDKDMEAIKRSYDMNVDFTQTFSGKIYATVSLSGSQRSCSAELTHPQFMDVLPMFIESLQKSGLNFSINLDYYEEAYGARAAENLYEELTKTYKIKSLQGEKFLKRKKRAISIKTTFDSKAYLESLRERSIVSLDLSVRATNALAFNVLKKWTKNGAAEATLGDVLDNIPSLLAAEKIGKKTAHEIINKLKSFGISVPRWDEEFPEAASEA